MKKLIILVLMLGLVQISFAQKKTSNKKLKTSRSFASGKIRPVPKLSLGPKVGLGFAYIHSANLPVNLLAQAETSAQIAKWSSKGRLGTYSGIGLFAQYDFTKRFSLISEATYNPYNAGFDLLYIEDNRTAGGTGILTTVNSNANIKSAMWSVPLIARFNIINNRSYAAGLLGGLRFNLMGSTHIRSEETETKDFYSDQAFRESRQEMRNATASLDVFRRQRNHLIIGLVTTFKETGNGLMVDIRYNMPVTRSELYTNNASFINHSYKNNNLFGYVGKEEAEATVPGYKLNDFKLGMIEVCVSYQIFKR